MSDTTPRPTIYAYDVWNALRLPPEDFDPYLNRNGWADTWAGLMCEISVLAGAKQCGQLDDEGEPCVLLEHSSSTPHYADGDVGKSEPLPARSYE